MSIEVDPKSLTALVLELYFGLTEDQRFLLNSTLMSFSNFRDYFSAVQTHDYAQAKEAAMQCLAEAETDPAYRPESFAAMFRNSLSVEQLQLLKEVLHKLLAELEVGEP